jgi:hypothetical protein
MEMADITAADVVVDSAVAERRLHGSSWLAVLVDECW